MAGTYRASGRLRCARTTLTTLALAAATGVAYRIHRASELGLADLLTSIAAALFLTSAMAAGWLHHLGKVRQEVAADWEERRLRHDENLLDGEEDRALWDSIEPWGSEDTCAFGLNVVAINQWRNYPQAG